MSRPHLSRPTRPARPPRTLQSHSSSVLANKAAGNFEVAAPTALDQNRSRSNGNLAGTECGYCEALNAHGAEEKHVVGRAAAHFVTSIRGAKSSLAGTTTELVGGQRGVVSASANESYFDSLGVLSRYSDSRETVEAELDTLTNLLNELDDLVSTVVTFRLGGFDIYDLWKGSYVTETEISCDFRQ